MQVLVERITALITVIQSLLFFPVRAKCSSGIIPFSREITNAYHRHPTCMFLLQALKHLWPSHKIEKVHIVKEGPSVKCSLRIPSAWMDPYLGLHTQGGEVCGGLWWETSVCDMGALHGWGWKKWASLHLLQSTDLTMLIICDGGGWGCLCHHTLLRWTQ